MSQPDASWTEYRRLVLQQLEEHQSKLNELQEKCVGHSQRETELQQAINTLKSDLELTIQNSISPLDRRLENQEGIEDRRKWWFRILAGALAGLTIKEAWAFIAKLVALLAAG